MRKLLIALPLLVAAPLMAQMQMPKEAPGKADAKRVTAGVYAVETNHTLIEWSVNHFGFNNYFGLFGGATGTMKLDPAKLAATTLSIDIPISGLTTTNSKLNEHLSGAEFLNTAQFPAAKFVSTMVMPKGNNAQIMGNLTLHGVTKPVTLNATFIGAGVNGFSKKETIGFQATTRIKRSEFAMGSFVPLVSDAVDLKISVAFEKQ
jgi:polyisoprenoid-binding protein YceI